MRRREFIAVSSAAAFAWPLAARGQQKAARRIAVLSVLSPEASASRLAAFRQSLSEAGFAEGRTLTIEHRWAVGNYDRLPGFAAEFVSNQVDLILAIGPPAARAAKEATSTVAVVFVVGSDPVATGLVASLSHPGGNLTGIAILEGELVSKRIELLAELIPASKRFALLTNPSNATDEAVIKDVQLAAGKQRVQLQIARAKSETEIDAAFAAFVAADVGAVIISPDSFFTSRGQQIAALAVRNRMPAISGYRSFSEAGGLISYGTDPAAAYRQAGDYAAKILNGAKPADLPVQQPSKFELVVNLKTARTLGLTVPQLLLAQADEVIE